MDGGIAIDTFTNDKIADPKLQDTMEKVTMRVQSKWERGGGVEGGGGAARLSTGSARGVTQASGDASGFSHASLADSAGSGAAGGVSAPGGGGGGSGAGGGAGAQGDWASGSTGSQGDFGPGGRSGGGVGSEVWSSAMNFLPGARFAARSTYVLLVYPIRSGNHESPPDV